MGSFGLSINSSPTATQTTAKPMAYFGAATSDLIAATGADKKDFS